VNATVYEVPKVHREVIHVIEMRAQKVIPRYQGEQHLGGIEAMIDPCTSWVKQKLANELMEFMEIEHDEKLEGHYFTASIHMPYVKDEKVRLLELSNKNLRRNREQLWVEIEKLNDEIAQLNDVWYRRFYRWVNKMKADMGGEADG
jgi:hypothetical protein